MKSTFKLKEPKSKDTTLILLKAYFDGNRLTYSTGLKVHPDNWLSESERCKEGRVYREGKLINSNIENILWAFTKAYYESDKTVNDVKRLMDIKLGKTIINDNKVSFIQYFDQHSKRFVKSHGYERGKKYNTTYNHLKGFFKEMNREYDWDDINTTFAEELEEYLYNIDTIKSQGYVSGILTRIKTVMKAGSERELHTNTKFIKIKTTEPEVFKIYLTVSELEKMYLCKELLPGEIEVRDAFLIACYTGLRFSDISRLKPEYINGNYIKIITSKTNTPVVIPIHPIIKDILTKRDGSMPKVYANAYMNKLLKDIGKKSKIKELVSESKIESRVKVDKTTPKYKLITTHTARRSFVTNLLLNGATTLSIMKMTGHSTDRSFLKYVKMSSEQNANIMMENSFFK